MKKRTNKELNELVDNLLSRMALEEKIGQLYQSSYDDSAITGPAFDNSQCLILIKKGLVGSIIGQYDNQKIYNLQKSAVEKTRLGIPLLFCNDLIHGCRTCFPINLAMSSSWNLNLIKKAMEVVAYEASHSGVHVTYSPMLDLVRDPRWGRVMEANGEDPYLSKEIAKAYVKGYQGHSYDDNHIASCAKHFIGYGACMGGRDYDSVDMSENNLFDNYLPSFKGAIDSGVAMVMSAFNTFNGLPVTMNKYLLTDVLRRKLHFKGIVISDYTSTVECKLHKTAATDKEVAKKCLEAGLDMEMMGTTYLDHLKDLVKENQISETTIDNATRRVLKLKYQLGLFDDPYKNIYIDFEKYWLKKEHLDVALEIAEESICLLKNDAVLPLTKLSNICFIGPFVKEKKVIGAWGGKAQVDDTVTLYDALKNELGSFDYAKGCEILDENQNDFNEALEVCKKHEIILMTVGEDQWMSGENTTRVNLALSKAQENLLDAIIQLGKKVILIVYAGRPLVLTKYNDKVAGIVYAWFLGTMSGKAITNILFGNTNPSGKLTMSFPYDVGQIPVFYNHLPTGRPHNYEGRNDYLLRYLDIPLEPLYPFGYGLSYANFKYGEIILSNDIITKTSPIKVSVEVTNITDIDGKEIVEVYIEALQGTLSRPVKELKHFTKILIPHHQTKKVEFTLTYKDLQYYNHSYINEEGKYRIFIGASSMVRDYKEVFFRF